MSATCKSCGAPILWAVSETTGKQHPIDVAPVSNGNALLIWPDYVPRGMPEAPPTVQFVKTGRGAHRSHFASCPHASQHRRPRR